MTINETLTRKDLRLSVPCIICGEYVDLTDNEQIRVLNGYHDIYKVCNDCVEAVDYAKKLLKDRMIEGEKHGKIFDT